VDACDLEVLPRLAQSQIARRMGNVISFPVDRRQRVARTATDHSSLQTAYRRDLQRALEIITSHVQSGDYDGIVAVLHPKSTSAAPVIAVGGQYRHDLREAANASRFALLSLQRHLKELPPDAQSGSFSD